MAADQNSSTPAQTSSVADLVSSRIQIAANGTVAPKQTTAKKFSVDMEPETKADLDELAAATKVGKIELASKILRLGIEEAMKTLRTAQAQAGQSAKSTDGGSTGAPAPAVPATPATPAQAPKVPSAGGAK